MLFPAIRWKNGSGFDHEREKIAAGLRLGVGGFILFGGEARAVRDLTRELRAASAHPLLIGADLERGAGQQFRDATRLPPLAALGSLDDVDTTRRAGALTAREALSLGVNWVYAPVADIDLEPLNPIVGSRAFGGEAQAVARHVTAWIEGCRAEGALACAKHFPGHGRTITDSHVELPRVAAGRDDLETDLEPFRAAVRAGVDSIMSAHVVYESLDPAHPATLSPIIVGGLLRGELGFEGLVVTDAMNMSGVLAGADTPGEAGARALAAGADALLYPDDAVAAARAVEDSVGGLLSESRVGDALARLSAIAGAAPADTQDTWGRVQDGRWALELARRSLIAVRGRPELAPGETALVTVDDDVGGPYPSPSREPFREALTRHGAALGGSGRGLVALYADIRGWKGRPGVSRGALERIERIVSRDPDAVIVLFGHPRLAAEIPGEHVLGAWGGEALMQEAAAAWLLESRTT